MIDYNTGSSVNQSSNESSVHKGTVRQRNAVCLREIHLSFNVFSRQGLNEQLEYEGFGSISNHDK